MNFNRILVVNVNWVGDVIFSSPIFKALKKKYPHSKISCLGAPRVKEILESIPCLDDIIVYDEQGAHRSPLGKLKLILQLRERKFDAAFLLHKSLTHSALVFLAGIPRRVGYDTKNRGFLLTHRVHPSREMTHRSDYYLRVVESFGVAVDDKTCALCVDAVARKFVEELLEKHGVKKGDFLVVINAGGNWDLKRWPPKNFALLSDRLFEQFKAKVVIPGAEKDLELAGSIASLCRFKPVILARQTNLKQLAALFKRADMVIAADTGPLHLANCVGTDTIGLFGPTRPEITGPRGAGRSVILQNDVGCNRVPCYNLGCPVNVCMYSISVNDVIAEIRKIKS